jgi:Fe2+ or Zn2+ uptake regulation protein
VQHGRSRREALLELIRQSDGLSRGELLERMGLKGDKSGEMSVSNALTTLTKSDQVHREDGKYRATK